MKGGHNKKSVRVEFVMSEPEAELVKERMAELGITNLSMLRSPLASCSFLPSSLFRFCHSSFSLGRQFAMVMPP